MTTSIPDNNLPNVFIAGNYFTSHFFMGGEKFDTPHPEGYLFGENMDLNFLGNRPVQVTKWNHLKTLRVWHFSHVFLTHTFWSCFPQFPYVTPAPHEPVKTLRSLVNIRKDSLRLVRYIVNIIMVWRGCWWCHSVKYMLKYEINVWRFDNQLFFSFFFFAGIKMILTAHQRRQEIPGFSTVLNSALILMPEWLLHYTVRPLRSLPMGWQCK